jgi:hypothetical protein
MCSSTLVSSYVRDWVSKIEDCSIISVFLGPKEMQTVD